MRKIYGCWGQPCNVNNLNGSVIRVLRQGSSPACELLIFRLSCRSMPRAVAMTLDSLRLVRPKLMSTLGSASDYYGSTI